MSDPGKGAPVDALDSVCKKYKDCVKCASMTYGDQCIGEFVKYKFVTNGNGPTCRVSDKIPKILPPECLLIEILKLQP